MRLLKSSLNAVTTLLLTILLLFTAAPVQAAAQAEAGSGYGFMTALSVGAFFLGGAVLQLTARDGEGEKTITLDTEDEPQTLLGRVKEYAQLKVSEVKSSLQAKLTAAQEENEGLRGILVGEILRIKKLKAGTGEDGEPDFDVEDEKTYLEGLPVERLKMEWKRLPAREEVTAPQTKTTGGAPDDAKGEVEDVYGEAVA